MGPSSVGSAIYDSRSWRSKKNYPTVIDLLAFGHEVIYLSYTHVVIFAA